MITITWGTKTINIPKADTSLVQSNPTEIRELGLNAFRLALKDLEESVEGMPFPDTHIHNTEVTLGSLTFARVIEIINGYTITFEDGQYAVDLTGANSNVGDVVNVNQVSVRSYNSAGLISNPAIEYASFDGGVSIDVTSDNTGTIYDVGTPNRPVNNIDDALLIAGFRGFTKLYVKGDLTINGGTDVQGFTIYGQSSLKSTITLNDGAITDEAEFEEAYVTGILDGYNILHSCEVGDLTFFNGQIAGCGLTGTIILGGDEAAIVADCYTIDQDSPPTINMGGSGQDLAMPNYSGLITITNLTSDTEEIGIGLNAGMVMLDSGISGGTVVISGIGILTDNSTGTASVNSDGLINKELIHSPSWIKVFVDTVDGTPGTAYPLGTKGHAVDNWADAKAIAVANSIEMFHLHNDLVLTSSADLCLFESHSHDMAALDINGQSTVNCVMQNLDIVGTHNGHIDALNCVFPLGATNIDAALDNCVLMGTFVVAPGVQFTGDRCTATGAAGIVVNLSGTGSLGLANFSGVCTVVNVNSAASVVSLTGNYIATLTSSCIAGTAMAAGIGIFDDKSAGMTVIEKTLPGSVWSDSEKTQILAGTANMDAAVSTRAAPGDAMTLTSAAELAVATAVIDYNMGDGRTVKEALSSARNRWRITGSGNPYTYEVYDTDDSTVLWSAQATVTAGGEIQSIVPI